jgi:phosphoribosylglycinamide formyltransferase 1
MPGVTLLAGDGPSTWVVANALAKTNHDVNVILETAEPTSTMLRRRCRNIGLVQTFGQILFILWARLAGKRRARRCAEILAERGLSDAPWNERVTRVSSANDDETANLLRQLNPEVVVVNGTRILSRRLLASLSCPVLNTHAGVTPAYRGVHGGYWALASGDRGNFGTTVHLVDAGVDTGHIVAQVRVEPRELDDFFTYPTLQLATAIPAIVGAVAAARSGQLASHRAEGHSMQWYHPTLWGYFWVGWRRGVW